MATLTPTITLASTDVTADETLNLTVTDSLTVAGGSTTFQVVTSTSAAIFLANGGYTKSYVFLKNLSTDAAEIIHIRIATAGDLSSGTATGSTDTMDLGAGEFAFFPWSADGDIAYDAASGTPTLEVRVYQAAAA
tara:strand:+ start:398 stop:802 length:405 start_codon:yes stop_codon:yes gene_type:complete